MTLGPVIAALLVAASADRPRAVPTLPRDAKLDGNTKELAGGLALKSTEGDAKDGYVARFAVRKDLLLVGIDVSDGVVTPLDTLSLALQFPDAGTTARGYLYKVTIDGLKPPDGDSGLPPFAAKLVKAVVQRNARGFSVELAIPARALPRFPSKEPLVLDACLVFEDRDEPGVSSTAGNCRGGATVGGPLRLPDDVRKQLKLSPPEVVQGIEARESGWVGFGALHYPHWVQSDVDLTQDRLARFVADAVVEPKVVHIPVPERMELPDGRPLYAILTGKDPYVQEGECNGDDELRLGLYAVTGKTATRGLEWPAATCVLGRAVSIALNHEGALTIGYSNGAVTHFLWSSDHFERTEYGKR